MRLYEWEYASFDFGKSGHEAFDRSLSDEVFVPFMGSFTQDAVDHVSGKAAEAGLKDVTVRTAPGRVLDVYEGGRKVASVKVLIDVTTTEEEDTARWDGAFMEDGAPVADVEGYDWDQIGHLEAAVMASLA